MQLQEKDDLVYVQEPPLLHGFVEQGVSERIDNTIYIQLKYIW